MTAKMIRLVMLVTGIQRDQICQYPDLLIEAGRFSNGCDSIPYRTNLRAAVELQHRGLVQVKQARKVDPFGILRKVGSVVAQRWDSSI